MFKIEVEQTSQTALFIKIDRAIEGARAGLRAGINAATIHLSTVIKRDFLSGQLVNRRTGNLSRAVFQRMVDDVTGVVGVGKEAPYGRFVNDGTRPYVIVPVNAKALRFVIDGKTIFAKRVNHPGIAARHFMEAALAASRGDIQKIIADRVNRGFKGRSVE